MVAHDHKHSSVTGTTTAGLILHAHTPDVQTGVIADATAGLSESINMFTASAMAAGMRDTDVASRVAVMLMSTQYDDLSDDGYVVGRDKFMSVLQVHFLRTSLYPSSVEACASTSTRA